MLATRRLDGQGSKHGLDGRTQSMTRDGKIGVAVRGWPLAPRLLFIAAFLSFCGAGHAAGSASGSPSPTAGEIRRALASPVRLARRSGRRRWQRRRICPGLPSGLGIFPAVATLKMAMGKLSSIGGMTKSAFPRAIIVKPGSPACAAPITGRKVIGPVYCCVEWRGCVWRLRTL